MGYKYLLHPDGADNNGGGFDQLSGSTTFTTCHSSFAPVAIQNSCAVTNNGGMIRITSAGNFGDVVAGTIAYCDFNAVYDDGRYVIVDCDTNWVDILIPYSSDDTVNIRIGGAIKSPDVACLLAYGDSDDELLLPANQSSQTENLVVDEGNRIWLVDEGGTLNMYGVNESTGVLLGFDDLWPVIKATGTWSTASLALLFVQDGDGAGTTTNSYTIFDKVIFDGNDLTPYVIRLGDNSGDDIGVYWGDVEIKNADGGKNGTGIGLYRTCYGGGTYGDNISYLKISGCYQGVYNYGARNTPNIYFLWIDDCEYGLYASTDLMNSLLDGMRLVLISNCDIGFRKYRYDVDSHVRITFVNNTVDVSISAYGTTSYYLTLNNCLFYNDAESGYLISVDNDDYVSVELINCVLGNLSSLADTSRFDGITPTLTNCQFIDADPFMDKDGATPDYRLDPDFADLAKIWDWDNMTNNIGATTPANPAGEPSEFLIPANIREDVTIDGVTGTLVPRRGLM